MQKTSYNKTDLRNFVNDSINGKIKTLDFYLNFSLEASREIKKTSKYDSIREEIQEEIYHLDKQMVSLKSMQAQMRKVVNTASDIVKLGSLVITNKARFYISVSLGEFFFENIARRSSAAIASMSLRFSAAKPVTSVAESKGMTVCTTWVS